MRQAKSGDHVEKAHKVGSLMELLGWSSSANPLANDALDLRIRSLAPVWLTLALAVLPMPILFYGEIMTGKVRALPIVAIVVAPILALLLRNAGFITSKPPHIRARFNACVAAYMGFCLSFISHDAAALSIAPTAFLLLGATMMVMIAAFSRLQGSMLAFPIGLMALGPPLGEGPLVWVLSLFLLGCLVLLTLRVARVELQSSSERWLASHNATRANRLIEEFEENGPGWFWETDRQGMISYISEKVAEAMPHVGKLLIGKPLSVIALEQGDNAVGERSLSFYLSSRTVFNEVAVLAATKGEERWWSVSGRPVADKYGQFRGFIGTGSDLTERRKSAAEVERLARFDSLTGLANRSETSNLLNRALVSRPGVEPHVGLMMLDLDRFKAVNDTLGHPVGDELLKLVASRLSEIVGAKGQVGRLGGDEFKIVLPGMDDRRQLALLAEAVIESLSKPYYINAAPVTIGASVGIAIAPTDGTTSEELIRNADLALYAAKGAGRGVHSFYETTMHSVAEQKRLIENDMRKALASGEFRMVYQPIVSLEHEKIIGFESLIRWNHPTRGPISPADFIPIAEENGMIEAIGEWALRTAAHEAACWAVDARVAVNVSTIQFANAKFPAVVASVLAQSGLENDRLELEITESVFVDDSAATDQQFALLKKLGVRLALDDFGTGYSSLGYLKRAPFDKIKIDQSFVRGASLGHDKNAAIIKAIVTLADTLGMETTAEGVETQDEIDFIKSLGCSHIQGFVYGKPLEAEDLRERLGTRGTAAERMGHKATREPRMRVFRASQLEINGRSHPVRIRNISNGGAMVEGPDWVAEGTEISVDVTDTFTAHGKVRWADEGRLGIQFEQRIDLGKVVTQVLKAG